MARLTFCHGRGRIAILPYSRHGLPLIALAWLVPALVSADAFLFSDGHLCLDTLQSTRGSMVARNLVDAYVEAIVGAMFKAGHIAVDGSLQMKLLGAGGAESLLRASDLARPLGDEYVTALPARTY